MASGKSLNLCLNGYKLYAKDNRLSVIENNGTLNICDCNGSNSINYGKWNSSFNKYEISENQSEGADTIIGGIITGGKNPIEGRGAGIHNTNALNIYSGNIAGNFGVGDNKCSGGIYNTNALNIYGGKIIGNYAMGNGSGGVYNEGNMNIYGGNIEHNNSNNGGGIRNEKAANITMNGGNIINNHSGSFGGGIQNSGTLIINDGNIIKNVSGNGGGIMNYNILTVEGGTISENIANDGDGGGIYNATIKDLNIKGYTTINGGIISENIVEEGNGGGIYNECNLTINGGKITDNTASDAGSGIYNEYVYLEDEDTIYVKGEITISGGTITENKNAEDKEENLYLCDNTIIDIADSIINAKIGVTTQKDPITEGKPINISSERSADYSKYFISDNKNLDVVNTGNGNNQVLTLQKATVKDETPIIKDNYTPKKEHTEKNTKETNFWNDVKDEIQKANNGNVVKVNAKSYNQMPWTIMQLLHNRSVTLIIEWDGGDTITIPSGKAADIENSRVYYPLSLLVTMYDELKPTENTEAPKKDDVNENKDTNNTVNKKNPETGR